MKEGEEQKTDAEKKQTKHANIELFYVNINGLNEDKIKNEDFLHDIQEANIICLTETHLTRTQAQPVLKNCYGLHTIANRNINRGRNIKDVSIYIKETDDI